MGRGVAHKWMCLQRSEKGTRSLRVGVIGNYKLPAWVLGTKLGPALNCWAIATDLTVSFIASIFNWTFVTQLAYLSNITCNLWCLLCCCLLQSGTECPFTCLCVKGWVPRILVLGGGESSGKWGLMSSDRSLGAFPEGDYETMASSFLSFVS